MKATPVNDCVVRNESYADSRQYVSGGSLSGITCEETVVGATVVACQVCTIVFVDSNLCRAWRSSLSELTTIVEEDRNPRLPLAHLVGAKSASIEQHCSVD